MSVCSYCGKIIKVSGLNFCSKECMENKKYVLSITAQVILDRSLKIGKIKGSFMNYVKKYPNKTEKEMKNKEMKKEV
jgi:hypothetical protein